MKYVKLYEEFVSDVNEAKNITADDISNKTMIQEVISCAVLDYYQRNGLESTKAMIDAWNDLDSTADSSKPTINTIVVEQSGKPVNYESFEDYFKPSLDSWKVNFTSQATLWDKFVKSDPDKYGREYIFVHHDLASKTHSNSLIDRIELGAKKLAGVSRKDNYQKADVYAIDSKFNASANAALEGDLDREVRWWTERMIDGDIIPISLKKLVNDRGSMHVIENKYAVDPESIHISKSKGDTASCTYIKYKFLYPEGENAVDYEEMMCVRKAGSSMTIESPMPKHTGIKAQQGHPLTELYKIVGKGKKELDHDVADFHFGNLKTFCEDDLFEPGTINTLLAGDYGRVWSDIYSVYDAINSYIGKDTRGTVDNDVPSKDPKDLEVIAENFAVMLRQLYYGGIKGVGEGHLPYYILG